MHCVTSSSLSVIWNGNRLSSSSLTRSFDKNVLVVHTLGKGNYVADHLAKLGALQDEASSILNRPPLGMSHILEAYGMRVAFQACNFPF
ncbi:hypothetical protein CR513_58931, partial [Mucuna pruriens]